MPVSYINGFDDSGSISDLELDAWVFTTDNGGNGLPSLGTGRAGGSSKCLTLTGSTDQSGNVNACPGRNSSTDCAWGFAFFTEALPSGGSVIASPFFGTLILNPNGSLTVSARDHDGNGPYSTSSAAGVITAGVWYYIEILSNGTAGNGSIICVNGITVVSGYNIGTGQGTFYLQCGENYTFLFDDFYCSSDQSCTALGPQQVTSVVPNANGSHQQWGTVVGADEAYEAVDELAEDGDTSYIATGGTANARATFAHANISATGINAVMLRNLSKLDPTGGGGTRTVGNTLNISGTDYDQTAVDVGVNYAYVNNTLALSPATGDPFTAAELNNTQFGVICPSG